MFFYYVLVTCFYSLAKEVVSFIFGTRTKVFKIIAILSTALMLTSAFLLTLLCTVLEFLLSAYLRVRHKGNFGGVLGIDTSLEHLKLTISYVYIVEHHDSYQEIFSNTKAACQTFHNSHYKFSSIIKKCCGIYYYVKNQVSFSDIISEADENCSTKDELLSYLEMNHFNDFDSNIKLWDVKIFKSSIRWRNDNKVYYPIVVRFNHCIADAVCLSIFQNKYLLSDVTEERLQNALKKSKRPHQVLKESSLFRMNSDIRNTNCNYLSSTDSCKQHLALFVEEEPRYLESIRALCRNLQCTFTDIVLTACTASVLDYLKLHDISPNEINVGNTCRNISENTVELLNAKILTNNITLDFFNLPCMNGKDLEGKIKMWFKLLNKERKTANSELLFIGRKLLADIPAFIYINPLKTITKNICVALTNVPGSESAKIGNMAVRDCFVFVNNFVGTKFFLSLHSYEGRLQASLITAKSVPISRREMQCILENTFKHIDKLLEVHKIN